jgi:hypothetical protein
LVIGAPVSEISPVVGRSNPAIIRNVVDFPHPEGPTITKNSPSLTLYETPLTAVNSPNDFWTWSNFIFDIIGFGKYE